jgi:hypothetical protein
MKEKKWKFTTLAFWMLKKEVYGVVERQIISIVLYKFQASAVM